MGSADRRDVDDSTRTALFHISHEDLRSVHNAVKVKSEDLVDGLLGMLLDRTDGDAAARIVDENVKLTEIFVGIFFQLDPAVVVLYVLSENIVCARFLLRFFKS